MEEESNRQVIHWEDFLSFEKKLISSPSKLFVVNNTLIDLTFELELEECAYNQWFQPKLRSDTLRLDQPISIAECTLAISTSSGKRNLGKVKYMKVFPREIVFDVMYISSDYLTELKTDVFQVWFSFSILNYMEDSCNLMVSPQIEMIHTHVSLSNIDEDEVQPKIEAEEEDIPAIDSNEHDQPRRCQLNVHIFHRPNYCIKEETNADQQVYSCSLKNYTPGNY